MGANHPRADGPLGQDPGDGKWEFESPLALWKKNAVGFLTDRGEGGGAMSEGRCSECAVEGFLGVLLCAFFLGTIFAIGHWIGRTNAESRAAAEVKAEKEEGR